MKEKILNFLKSNIFFSVVLNIIILAFCIAVTSFSYDNMNDFYDSIYICQHHNYYSHILNYILTTIVGSIQYVFTDINCYVLSQVLLSCTAFISITYVLADKFGKKKSLAMSLLLNILFATNHYADIQSNKTAAILLAAGFLLALNAIRNKRYNLSCWIGVAETALGSFYSYKYFFIALLFAIAFFAADMISKRKYKIKFRKFFWYFRPFLLLFAFITLVTVGLYNFSYSVNHATQDAANYYEYSVLNDKINNLPYPDYAEYEERFNEVGIANENDYYLLKNGYFDNDRSLNLGALKLVAQIQSEENDANLMFAAGNIFTDFADHITGFDCWAIMNLLLLLISIIYIIIHKKRFAFFPVFYFAAAFISSICLRILFSGSSYLIYGLWLMMYVFLLYSFDFENQKPKKATPILRMKGSNMFIASISLLCLFAVNCIVFQANYEAPSAKNAPNSLYTEIDRHPDRYYVLDTVTANEFMKYTENYLHPMWGFRPTFLDNVDGFGYYHNYEELRSRNLPDNIYEAILSDNKVYVVDKYITFRKEKYFSNNYSTQDAPAVYNQVKDINGYKIYEVTANNNKLTNIN